MDILEEYYGSNTFTLYGLFAVVPGKKTWPRLIFVTLGTILLLFIVLFQVVKLVIERFEMECFIDLAATTAASFGTLVYLPYVAFATDHEYKVLLSIMLSDLREERTEEENALKRPYAESVKFFGKLFTITLITVTCGVSSSGFIPLLLNILIPLNESRQMQLVVNGEFFIDQEKYFYYIYFLESSAVTVLCIIIFISENMSVIIMQHVCGMWAVIGYRLENLTEWKKDELSDKVGYAELVERRLHRCIVAHQKVLHFIGLAAAFYDVPLTLILLGSFCTLTVSLVQVMDPQLFTIKMMVIMVSQIFQLFLISYMGQCVIDSSKQVAESACNAEWDICSGNARRLLQLIILRASKPCVIVARGIYILSIENFMSVMQTATSCFMVLRQTC